MDDKKKSVTGKISGGKMRHFLPFIWQETSTWGHSIQHWYYVDLFSIYDLLHLQGFFHLWYNERGKKGGESRKNKFVYQQLLYVCCSTFLHILKTYLHKTWFNEYFMMKCWFDRLIEWHKKLTCLWFRADFYDDFHV